MNLANTSYSITALALRRPVTCFMVMLSMIVTGLVATKLIRLDTWPALNVPIVFVQANYPGSTPEEVERRVTKPLEEALSTMGEVTSISSDSTANGSNIRVRMALSADLNSAILEAREKVDLVRHRLPDDIERVDVLKFSTQDFAAIEVSLMSAQKLEYQYDFLTKQLKMPLERIVGVGRVDLHLQQPRVWIELDPNKLAMNRLDIDDVLNQLNKANFLKSVGEINTQALRYTVTPYGQYTSLDDIRAQRINARVSLGDIASVGYTFSTKRWQRNVNGQPAIGLDVYKESDANVVAVAKEVRTQLKRIFAQPSFKHIEYVIDNDDGQRVELSINSLVKAGAIGAILSFFVLLVFLRNFLLTSVVVLAVPVSLCVSIAVIYFMGYSLNMLTLMGLIIAIGLLIDNSVVVCESILQQQDSQISDHQSIIKGVDKVSTAILSATLTTIVIFLPLLMGEKNFITIMLEQIAISICVPLITSLLVAKTVIPLCMSFVLKKQKGALPKQHFTAQDHYRRFLSWGFEHKRTVACIFLLMFGSVFFVKSIVDERSSSKNREDSARIFYNFHSSPDLDKRIQFVEQVESYLLANKQQLGIKNLYSGVYSRGAWSMIEFVDDLPKPIKVIKKQIADNFPESAYATALFQRRKEDKSAVEVYLFGRSTTQLMELSKQIVPLLNAQTSFSNARNSNSGQLQEVQLKINRARVVQLGLTTEQVAAKIGSALRGQNLKSLRLPSQGEIDLMVGYFEKGAASYAELKSIPVVESDGVLLTLQQIAEIEITPVAQSISRVDRQTQLSVAVDIDDISHKEAAKELTKLMDSIAFPAGYSWGLGPKFKEDDEGLRDMAFNMLIALCLIFMIMAALFESLLMPIAILSSIGLAFVGVYWTFALLGLGMGETGMIGMLILMGIVVNNGIVLIDQINRFKGQAEDLLQAILDACVTRLRPIIMTVMTTVMGMIPVLLENSQANSGVLDYKPMAIAIIGGLLFSTITSLAFVPYCYYMLWRLGQGVSKRLANAKHYAQT